MDKRPLGIPFKNKSSSQGEWTIFRGCSRETTVSKEPFRRMKIYVVRVQKNHTLEAYFSMI
jgi:hypothetical protein